MTDKSYYIVNSETGEITETRGVLSIDRKTGLAEIVPTDHDGDDGMIVSSPIFETEQLARYWSGRILVTRLDRAAANLSAAENEHERAERVYRLALARKKEHFSD